MFKKTLLLLLYIVPTTCTAASEDLNNYFTHKRINKKESAPVPTNGICDYKVFKARQRIRELAANFIIKGRNAGNKELAKRENNLEYNILWDLGRLKEGLRLYGPVLNSPWGNDLLLAEKDTYHNTLPDAETVSFLNELESNGVILEKKEWANLHCCDVISVDKVALPTVQFTELNQKKDPITVVAAAESALKKRYEKDFELEATKLDGGQIVIQEHYFDDKKTDEY